MIRRFPGKMQCHCLGLLRNAPTQCRGKSCTDFRIVVHCGDGEPEVLQVRDVIRAGGHSRAIALQGDLFVKSFELWYARANPNSGKPELTLWG